MMTREEFGHACKWSGVEIVYECRGYIQLRHVCKLHGFELIVNASRFEGGEITFWSGIIGQLRDNMRRERRIHRTLVQ